MDSLLLSQVSGGAAPNKLWENELNFFLDLYRADWNMPFAEMPTRYRWAGKHMQMASTSIGDMPTMDTILHMKRVPGILEGWSVDC